MKFKKPNFWDLKKPNFLSNLLNPLTIIIRMNNFFLNLKTKNKTQKVKTICIGNIYVGGTGKTPTSIELYRILKKLDNNISVGKKFYSSQEDEQIILNDKTDFISGINRKEVIDKANTANKNLLIFDDGLQDKYVSYDLQFVCFDAKKWVGNGRLLPAGPLREKIESLKKYDGVFLKNIDENSQEIIDLIKSINPKIEIFQTKYVINNLKQFDIKSDFLIFSGIGNPESFKELLIKNNFKVIKEIIFPDHYQYKKKDLEKIIIMANKLNAKILTTEKDYVKIKNFDNSNIKFLDLDLKFKDEENLINYIKKRLYG